MLQHRFSSFLAMGLFLLAACAGAPAAPSATPSASTSTPPQLTPTLPPAAPTAAALALVPRNRTLLLAGGPPTIPCVTHPLNFNYTEYGGKTLPWGVVSFYANFS